jgi:hypothetical protein
LSTLIQYTGFQVKARGRDYSYRVVIPKTDPREFTITITNRSFEDRHILYQDGAAICYLKLQRELLAETADTPLDRHFTVSDQELDSYRLEHRPARKSYR